MFRLALITLLVLFSHQSFACQFDNISFDKNFSGGRFTECKQISKDQFLLTLTPENTPINNSPWYAFKVSAKEEQNITVILHVTGGDHRYPPKASMNGRQWQLIEHLIDGDKMAFKIDAKTTPTWISAQEILSNKEYVNWGERLAKKSNVTHDIQGWSVQERPIYKILAQSPGKEWLVVLGRQHPPEITGALALLPFTETLLSDLPLAKTFRERFNIVVFPNLNPDGVYMGNWRHNANGVDLNRDWKTFAQKEVVTVHNYLQNLVAQGEKIAFGVDFHSTHKEIFYTMPSDYGVEKPLLVDKWLTALDKQYPNFSVIQKPGNNPDKGVSKQYFADVYKVHAITYEMGDRTDRQFIFDLAQDAAITLMETLLADNNGE